MIFLKFILYILTFFTTLLWFNKLLTDCASAMFGNNFTDEEANKDGALRLYLSFFVSLFWTIIIIL